jgi:P-type Ca2+ transporter type 2C
MTTTKHPIEGVLWYALSAGDAAERIGVDPDQGLDVDEAVRRLAEYGPNELPTEPPPSVWTVARGQLSNPMNIMLLIVCVASFAIAQVATGVVVLGLVTFNVVMGSSQELKARASVEALAQLQVPRARVRRSGQVAEVESTELVPGDVVLLEAGDVVPADGRIFSSATLEVQEAALTGESAPIAKDRVALPESVVASDHLEVACDHERHPQQQQPLGVLGDQAEVGGAVAEQRRRQQQDQREPTAWILISPHLHWCSLQDDPKLSVKPHTSRRRGR